MRYLLFVFAVASIALFAFAGTGVADPNLANVPAHQHFVITAQGEWIAVGPQVCGIQNPKTQRAFNQFHFNIHHSFIPGTGPGTGQIDTLGPQDGAPGLHNLNGADMTGRPCEFVAP
jgi:hypothetical protein